MDKAQTAIQALSAVVNDLDYRNRLDEREEANIYIAIGTLVELREREAASV